MSDAPTPQPPLLPRWVPGALVGLLTAQLAMLWLQGLQMNRQHHDLVELRGDLQALVESLDQGAAYSDEAEPGPSPARYQGRSARDVRSRRAAYVRVRQTDPKPEPRPEGDQDPASRDAAKELKQVQDSAKKAVADARDIQSKLSLEENARKAAEKAKVKEARASWEMWALVAGAALIGALLLRGWLRSREG